MIEPSQLPPPARGEYGGFQGPSYPGRPADDTGNLEFSSLRARKEIQFTRGSSSQRCWPLFLPGYCTQEINRKRTEKRKVELAYRGEVHEKRAMTKTCIHLVIFTKCSLAKTA